MQVEEWFLAHWSESGCGKIQISLWSKAQNIRAQEVFESYLHVDDNLNYENRWCLPKRIHKINAKTKSRNPNSADNI